MNVLLVVDAQKGFISDPTVIDNLVSVWDSFDLVFATMFVSQNKNNLYESELDWSGLSSTETKLHPEISSRVLNENIFLKSTYNATTNPDLIDRLETLDITEVYIAGFETDACVLATAFALFDRGIRPIVIKSCCSSAEPTVHTTALRILQRNIGAQNIITHTEL